MLPIKQKIYNVASTYLQGRRFSRGDLIVLLDRHYPGTNHDSVLPSDYLYKDALKRDPSNVGNRYNFMTCPRFLERLDRDTYVFVGWDGIAKGALNAPVVRSPQASTAEPKPAARPAPVPRHVPPPRPIGDGSDLQRLVDALAALAPVARTSSDRVRVPALRVLDCVLSLNRQYDAFLVPRLNRFERHYPRVRTVTELQTLISRYASPGSFLVAAMDYNDFARAQTLKDVVDWMVNLAGPGDDAAQLANLERWATSANPDGHSVLSIRGFGIAGFQYMRMLFGANTAKPDIHIRRYVEDRVSHPVSDARALQLLELAAERLEMRVVDLDTTIWERAARGRSGGSITRWCSTS